MGRIIVMMVVAFYLHQVFTYSASLCFTRKQIMMNRPQQVHISLSGKKRMRISWVTEAPTPAIVYYGTSPGNYTHFAKGSLNMYHFLKYDSKQLHDVIIGPLNPNTLYYYTCGHKSSRHFTLKTPPSLFPIKFAVAGDLGQSKWTRSTLRQIGKSNYDVMIVPGDLSYADRYQPKWDSFGSMVQPLASQRPWMVTEGNHDIETIKGLHRSRFTAYNARWVMPYQDSASPSNLFYSFDVAGVHVLMLGSYVDFGRYSAQLSWLRADLNRVDRKRTPWLVAVVHAPWYNSNVDHQREYGSLGMKESMEDLLFRARVDVVLAGHVHAYERFVRVYKDRANECGPMHVTVGAGGNRYGLAARFLEPRPKVSAFREANFGHGQLSIVNESHATWTWHRNFDNITVASDKIILRSLVSTPKCNKVSTPHQLLT